MAEVLEYHQRLEEHARQQQGLLPMPVGHAAHGSHLHNYMTCGRKRTFAEAEQQPAVGMSLCNEGQEEEAAHNHNVSVQASSLLYQDHGVVGFKRARSNHSASNGQAASSRSTAERAQQELRLRTATHAHASSVCHQTGSKASAESIQEEVEEPVLAQIRGQLVDYLINIMATARDASSARDSMQKALRVFQKRIRTHGLTQHADTKTKQQQQVVQEYQKENSILKKAVAIQNEKLEKEKEQIRQLELANYSLKAHLKQMTTSNAFATQPNRDIF